MRSKEIVHANDVYFYCHEFKKAPLEHDDQLNSGSFALCVFDSSSSSIISKILFYSRLQLIGAESGDSSGKSGIVETLD
ncbi:hypothetical protein [Viridibacillus arvi]|uniref:hypothetical protein n=1 Tax=Viridibacillus arvi TaxID=263475 RepID=UPI003CFE3163